MRGGEWGIHALMKKHRFSTFALNILAINIRNIGSYFRQIKLIFMNSKGLSDNE